MAVSTLFVTTASTETLNGTIVGVTCSPMRESDERGGNKRKDDDRGKRRKDYDRDYDRGKGKITTEITKRGKIRKRSEWRSLFRWLDAAGR